MYVTFSAFWLRHCRIRLQHTRPSPSSHIPMAKKRFIFLRAKFRNRSMVSDEALIELKGTDIAFKIYNAWQFEIYAIKKITFFNFNTYSRISLCSRTHYFRSSVILKSSVEKNKITIYLNLRSISSIGDGSLFFITQYWVYARTEFDRSVCK